MTLKKNTMTSARRRRLKEKVFLYYIMGIKNEKFKISCYPREY